MRVEKVEAFAFDDGFDIGCRRKYLSHDCDGRVCLLFCFDGGVEIVDETDDIEDIWDEVFVEGTINDCFGNIDDLFDEVPFE